MDKWYLTTSYGEAKKIIRDNMENLRRTFVATGYYLRLIKETKGYEEDGYSDIWEFAQEQYGLSKSTASRWMHINKCFSKEGYSPLLDEKYREFSKSQLQEMLYLETDKLEGITPEMTVKEIREIRTPELLSYYGTVKAVYPEGSMADIPGCNDGHSCFACHMQCGVRQKSCNCVDAPLGNPYPCTTINTVELLEQEVGDQCQFVNLELARVRADNEKVPCCKDCTQKCGYCCSNAARSNSPEESASVTKPEENAVATSQQTDPSKQIDCPPDIHQCIRQEWGTSEEEQHRGSLECAKCWAEYKKNQKTRPLEIGEEVIEAECEQADQVEEYAPENLLLEERKKLDEYIQVGGLPEKMVQRQKLLVAALASMVTELEQETSMVEQPELPVLKNNDQRKEFIDNYSFWPVWIETKETGEKYYRYDFSDGSSFVVKVYFHKCFDYSAPGSWEDRYHDDWGAEEYYLIKNNLYFKDCLTNKSTLVEHLKEIQKGDKKC